MVYFVILRVRTIESGFDHSLQLSQMFVPSALLFAFIAGVCLRLHINNLFRVIMGLAGELSQKAHLTS